LTRPTAREFKLAERQSGMGKLLPTLANLCIVLQKQRDIRKQDPNHNFRMMMAEVAQAIEGSDLSYDYAFAGDVHTPRWKCDAQIKTQIKEIDTAHTCGAMGPSKADAKEAASMQLFNVLETYCRAKGHGSPTQEEQELAKVAKSFHAVQIEPRKEDTVRLKKLQAWLMVHFDSMGDSGMVMIRQHQNEKPLLVLHPGFEGALKDAQLGFVLKIIPSRSVRTALWDETPIYHATVEMNYGHKTYINSCLCPTVPDDMSLSLAIWNWAIDFLEDLGVETPDLRVMTKEETAYHLLVGVSITETE